MEAQFLGGVVEAIRAVGTPTPWMADLGSAVRRRAHAQEQEFLDREVAKAKQRFPKAAIEGTLADDEPADALLKAAEDAHLVVVGCYHAEDRWSTRLGPVPAAILHRTACPVVVVGANSPRL